jgi:hypothetical protein
VLKKQLKDNGMDFTGNATAITECYNSQDTFTINDAGWPMWIVLVGSILIFFQGTS